MRQPLLLFSENEIAEILRNISIDDEKLLSICVYSSGEPHVYSHSDEEMQIMAKVGLSQTLYNEDIVKDAIKMAIKDSIPELVEWIRSKRAAFRTLVYFDSDCGYLLDNTGNRTDTNCAQVSFHKAVRGETLYGFFVSTVLPTAIKDGF